MVTMQRTFSLFSLLFSRFPNTRTFIKRPDSKIRLHFRLFYHFNGIPTAAILRFLTSQSFLKDCGPDVFKYMLPTEKKSKSNTKA